MPAEEVVWSACGSTLFALILLAPLALAPPLALICRKAKNKHTSKRGLKANGTQDFPGKKKPPFVPNDPVGLMTCQKILDMGVTRPPNDDESVKEVKSDWGSVQEIEEGVKKDEEKKKDKPEKSKPAKMNNAEKTQSGSDSHYCAPGLENKYLTIVEKMKESGTKKKEASEKKRKKNGKSFGSTNDL
ncbi:hypothetical protein QR680_003796 [Steinernema hermaphroditum]|uniref:Uncharacterized protein n=1 Tax=Steinernema hermaphroditum TaxID=289476 RepID=A0AA39HNU9_9BILA|nr:hypothetical protein QR680_003796 [Steinernema hermaphroditum]